MMLPMGHGALSNSKRLNRGYDSAAEGLNYDSGPARLVNKRRGTLKEYLCASYETSGEAVTNTKR